MKNFIQLIKTCKNPNVSHSKSQEFAKVDSELFSTISEWIRQHIGIFYPDTVTIPTAEELKKMEIKAPALTLRTYEGTTTLYRQHNGIYIMNVSGNVFEFNIWVIKDGIYSHIWNGE